MNPNGPNPAQWYCVRSKAKHEHIAAANIRRQNDFEVFSPRIRLRRLRGSKVSWVSEPLFPGYVFCKFLLESGIDRIRHTSGVKGVVQFGDIFPAVPEESIADLRLRLDGLDEVELPEAFEPGDSVTIAAGPFQGITATVQIYIPATQRLKLLFELLGSVAALEIDTHQVLRPEIYPTRFMSTFPSTA